MQIASRQPMWNEGGRGTVVEVNMTPTTGLKFQLGVRYTKGQNLVVDWGDHTKTERGYVDGDQLVPHTYAQYGKYKIVVEGVKTIGLRFLDGQAQYSYDAAVISVVDYCGQITGSQSAAF